PVLKPAMQSPESLISAIENIHRELVVSMYLTGSENIGSLSKVRTYITGITREMTDKRKIKE
ncbi:MAG: type 2 isopentenyl-diphosphate Delta-isomerase, partial [Methanomicrobium sp.]|nr:type 2 isopentenyl-diphosphate Delta-isomerase [Methanomicrobium sp.]